MRLPEAMEALGVAHRLSGDSETWNKESHRILESVWLTAYEEGRDRIFEAPPQTGDQEVSDTSHYGPNAQKYLAEHNHDYKPKHGSNTEIPT